MKLSVIIPTYNRAALLEPTLESVLRQTRQPDEVLVIDDGSTDETRAVVERWGEKVRYHYQPNAGLAAVRDKGLQLSSGELLCFLDSDDLLLPRALETLEAALQGAPEAALAYCRAQIIDADGKLLEPRWLQDDFVEDVWEHLVDGNFIRSSGCVLIRRSHLIQVEPWDANIYAIADWDMWLRLAETAPFVRVDETLFQYRVHETNMSNDPVRMYGQTLHLLRKHLKRNRRNAARRSYLRTARPQARYRIAYDLSRRAGLAWRNKDDGLALDYLLRAVQVRPAFLLEGRFLLWLLSAGLRVRRWRGLLR